MGLANVSPFNHAEEKQQAHIIQPKKQNETQDYRLNLNYTERAYVYYNTNTPIANSYYPTSQQRSTAIYGATAGNNYVNVLTNCYRQAVYTNVVTDNNTGATANIIENKKYIGNNLDYLYQKRCETLFIFQIDPYNYNVNTSMTIGLELSITEWENQNGIEWYTYNNYLIKNVYKSTASRTQNGQIVYDFAQYINMQAQEYQAYNIARDIENVNNGFYYEKTQTLKSIGQNTISNRTIYDTTTIELTAGLTNYFVIEYIPVSEAVDMGGDQDLELVIPLLGNTIKPSTISNSTYIQGTNIIPSGTYEVVNIPGLMFDILTMPFAFVSQAFNLTLFPGTPYQINIANLFLSLIAILVFVWLMKKFTKL